MRARLTQLYFGLASLLLGGATALGYAQSGNAPVHQWIAIQGQLFFKSQFGPSEIDSFVGEAIAYPAGNNNRFTEGTFDEDESDNPFGQTQPFNRHFWAHDGSFERVHDDGLQGFDSAISRAIQYFNGGSDMLNNYQGPGSLGCLTSGGWSCGQSSVRDQGIVWSYDNDTGNNERKGRAYYWLGHAAHLLQDLSLPVHSHADAHVELSGFDDPDPVHDWVDGRPFRTDGNQALGARGSAAFDDTTANRWQQWAYQPAQKGIGRVGGTVALDAQPLRSPANFLDLQDFLPDEQMDSVPARPTGTAARAVYDTALPLYVLGLDLAGRADNFDSDDTNGQVDIGARRNATGDSDSNQYNNWTQLELNQVADVAATGAIRATAELIRYYYSLVDTTAPAVNIPDISVDEAHPTLFELGQLPFQAEASDPLSGFDLDGFRFTVEKFDGSGWAEKGTTVPSEPQLWFNAERRGLYRLQASVENGGGLLGRSAFGYFQVVPEPGGLMLFLGAVAIVRLRRELKTRRCRASAGRG